MKGKADKGAVLIFLSDHEGQFVVKPPETLVDYENDPTIIGYGKILFEKDMTAYEKSTSTLRTGATALRR